MSTAERVLAALAKVAETDEIRRNPELELFELSILDSLGTIQLMIALSDEFGVEISPAELERDDWATPRKIVAYMERRVGL
jgi:D-alanine--poly(phosphoribitol) ligase subunit 2